MWHHQYTIFNRRHVLRIAGLVTLCVVLIATLLFANVVKATANVNQAISFQARLLQASGAVVPDGYYNIQFKIYQDGSGTAVDNPDGTLKWTETYINDGGTNGVQIKNGYLSVSLGSLTPFDTSVDWNQDTLWLSMNIAGSAATCTTFGSGTCVADGEMLPMKRITAVPQALNSDKLDGKDSSDFIQNSSTPQTADFNISGTGTASSLNAVTSVSTPSIDRADNGTLSIGTANASTIEIGTNDADHTVNIGTGTAGVQNVTVGSLSGNSLTRVQGGGAGVILQYTDGGFSVHDGDDIQRLTIGASGVEFNLNSTQELNITGGDGSSVLSVTHDHQINVASNSTLNVNGVANFDDGINITNSSSTYTTPLGATLQSAINIVNHNLDEFGSLLSLGITEGSPNTARGILVADARTNGTHQASIGVLSPDESQIFGFSWEGSSSTAYLKNSASTVTIRTSDITDVATFASSAINLLQPTTASATVTVATTNSGALLVQSGSSTQLFKADTSAMQVLVGSSGNTVTLSANGITLSGNARNTKKINLVPEYAGAVLDNGGVGNNQGSMTSQLDLTNRKTFYRWQSSVTTAQTYDVAVKVPIPQDFSAWVESNPIAITTRTSNSSNGAATVELRDTSGTVICNFSALTMGSDNTWTTNNPSCLDNGTYSPNDSLIIRVRMSAKSDATLDLGDITLTYLSNK
ncbi:MAG: hypothetical protein ACSLEY_00350 [Candidatus Saccharimonadales bacterium]